MGSEVIRLHFPDEEIRINGLSVYPRLDTRNHAHGYAELHYTFSAGACCSGWISGKRLFCAPDSGF